MLEWLQDNDAVLWWLGIGSVVTFVGTILLLPILVARIPSDHFLADRATRARAADRHPALRLALLIGKNLLGVIFVAAGFAMLFVPGQGLLTIVVGVMLMSFPGKRGLERWLISRRPILRSVNWMRSRAHRPPLELPPEQADAG